MLDFLKNLIKKSAPQPPRASSPGTSVPSVPSFPSSPSASAPVGTSPNPPVNDEKIELPFQTLAAKLPDPVQKFIVDPQGSLYLPLSLVLDQLPRGQVQISLGQLTQYSSNGSVRTPAEQAQSRIDLPLSEILPKLKPGQLAQRADQRKVTLAPDIPDIFPVGNSRPAIVTAPDSGPIFKPATPRSTYSQPPAPAPFAASAFEPLPASSIPAPQAASDPITDPAPQPPGIKAPALETAPIKTSVALPPPPPTALQRSTVHLVDPPPILASAPANLGEVPEGSISVPMSMMTSHFASLGHTEIANLHKANIIFPGNELEVALKKGKIIFPWRQVREWLQGVVSFPSLANDVLIEFPLNVVAPIYLQSKRVVKPQRKVEVTSHIPELFSKPVAPAGFKDASPSPASLSHSPAPPVTSVLPPGAPEATPAAIIIPPPPVLPLPSAEPVPPKPLMDFGEIFGVPSQKNWTLTDVVQKVATLRGVSGALIATSDGLLVAGIWPGAVPVETAAGFVPPIFTRIAQYSKELQLGDPQQFTLLVENLPIQLFKIGNNYFIIQGKMGEPLPKLQLSALALRLTQDTQPS